MMVATYGVKSIRDAPPGAAPSHVIQEPVFDDSGDALLPATFGGDFGKCSLQVARWVGVPDLTVHVVGLVAQRLRERRKTHTRGNVYANAAEAL